MLPCVAFLGDVKPNGHAAGCVVMCYRVLPCVAAEGVAGCCRVLQCVASLCDVKSVDHEAGCYVIFL